MDYNKGSHAKEDKKEKKKTNFIIVLLRLFFLILFVYSSIQIAIWYFNNNNNQKVINKVSNFVSSDDETTQINSIDFNSLRNINSSCFGWIIVNNTNISYPVIQYSNNEYYLTHSFDNSINSAGWVFADYRNKCDGNDKNLIIYGHNRRNGTMFNELNKCLNNSWYTDPNNHTITFYTPSEAVEYEIFSIYSIAAEDYYTTTSFASDQDFVEFINTLKNRSIYNFNIDLSSSDKILTLSTCSNNNANRTVIHAKKTVE